MDPGVRRGDDYFNQPRLRKYQNGAIALQTISAHAHA
jgi:hypothetical protein